MYKRMSLLIVVSVFASCLRAQDVPGQVANIIAQKMKDSLGLSASQKHGIYIINLNLHYQKARIRERYPADSIGHHIQRIENTRDSLYGTVLPEEKYSLYLEKKRRLVTLN